jgi:hypothetical protein
MIRRMLWLGVGLAVGAIVARQVTKTVQAYSPGNLVGSARNSAADVLDAVRDYVADVREGMAEREEEIHEAFAQGVSLTDLDADLDADFDDSVADWPRHNGRYQ